HPDMFEDGGAGAASADQRELMARRLDAPFQFLFGLFQQFRYHHESPSLRVLFVIFRDEEGGRVTKERRALLLRKRPANRRAGRRYGHAAGAAPTERRA